MFAKTFKVNAKRSDKKFPLNSPAICMTVGEKILDAFPNLTVDVHNPDIIVNVEIRDNYAFIHGNQIKGAGGMPVGTAGQAAILISGQPRCRMDDVKTRSQPLRRTFCFSSVHLSACGNEGVFPS